MISPAAARTMAEYKLWADELTLESVGRLPDGEAARERPSLFGSILGTLNHSYLVDLIWRAHLEGREHGFESRRQILHADIEMLRQAQRAYNEWLCDWCSRQSDEALNEPIDFRFVSKQPGRMTRGAIVLHIVTHATYHRGWVSDLFYQIPATPPTTDLSVFPGVSLRGAAELP